VEAPACGAAESRASAILQQLADKLGVRAAWVRAEHDVAKIVKGLPCCDRARHDHACEGEPGVPRDPLTLDVVLADAEFNLAGEALVQQPAGSQPCGT
jgi:hypothetical protein